MSKTSIWKTHLTDNKVLAYLIFCFTLCLATYMVFFQYLGTINCSLLQTIHLQTFL